MTFGDDLDVVGCARRAVARVRPSADVREDLLQQAVVLAYDLLKRFTPKTDPDAPPPAVQAERYLLVALPWHLRTYARQLRTSLSVSERDRRLARAHAQLLATHGALSTAEAARLLGVSEKRLARALAAQDQTISLDRPLGAATDDATTLAAQTAAADPGTEEEVFTALDDEQQELRQKLLSLAFDVPDDAPGPTRTASRRLEQQRRLVYFLLDHLPRGDAEVIRLAYALPRKELGSLRSCRTYGCRRDDGHGHSPTEIATWLHGAPAPLRRRLKASLDRLADLVGGRDPRPLLRAVSTATPLAGGTAKRRRSGFSSE